VFNHLLCPCICAVLAARQTGGTDTSPQVRGETTDSQRLTWHSHPAVLSGPLWLLPLGGGWDRRLVYQIFIHLLCSLQTPWTGKKHYVGISADAVVNRGNLTFWAGQQNCKKVWIAVIFWIQVLQITWIKIASVRICKLDAIKCCLFRGEKM